MTNIGNPAKVQGPNGDGSQSLAKESKAGLATALLVNAGAQFVLGGLANLDSSAWMGQWWGQLAVAGVSVLTGAVVAWSKKNR
jgi:hypothetical protein